MKRFISILLIIIFSAGMLTGCTGDLQYSNKAYDTDKISIDVVDSNSQFAFNILKQLASEDKEKNIFISPLSISTALAMAYQGAEGATKESMAKTLCYQEIDSEKLNDYYKNLTPYLKNLDKNIDLNMANSIWIREGVKIKEDFISINKDIFEASVSSLDFSKESSADVINKWISDATNNKIDKMIDPPISLDVVMYLINAIHFKGDWAEQFDSNYTFDANFHCGDGSTNKIKMMRKNGKIEYGDGDDYKAVRLPYGKGNIAMYCILPKDAISIDDFINKLDLEKWKNILKSIIEKNEVELQLPRFKLEYGIKNLNNSLTELGMGVAFSDIADFSGIGNDVCISNVLHKAIIEVNEKGSEAAAATAVEIRTTAAMIDPLTFIADRPFIFLIVDDQTETILFIGKASSL